MLKEDIGEIQIYELLDHERHTWMELELRNNTFQILKLVPRIIEPQNDLLAKLDSLLIEIIEAQQSGLEISQDYSSNEITPYDPDKIKVHSKQFSMGLIAKMLEDEVIDLNPNFQRNFVWTSKQKSQLIESVLLRIPLPLFYFAEDKEGRMTVVDGLQRLTTIRDFITNKFNLRGLEYLKDSCEGRYYSEKNESKPTKKKFLEPKYLRWFDYTQFTVNVIDPDSPSNVKFDIFRRINTGGKPLNNQEIRNCLASKELRGALKEMSELPEFLTATNKSIKSVRMEDQEVALRFMYFYNIYQTDIELKEYSGNMEITLDDFTEEIGKLKSSGFELYLSRYSNAMKNAEFLLGSKYAFRKITPNLIRPNAYKQLINKALFVTTSVLLSQFNHQKIVSKNEEGSLLLPFANLLENDNKLKDYLTFSTNSRTNLAYVFEKLDELFKKNINNELD
jgi:hypothetical protein